MVWQKVYFKQPFLWFLTSGLDTWPSEMLQNWEPGAGFQSVKVLLKLKALQRHFHILYTCDIMCFIIDIIINILLTYTSDLILYIHIHIPRLIPSSNLFSWSIRLTFFWHFIYCIYSGFAPYYYCYLWHFITAFLIFALFPFCIAPAAQ